MKIEEILKMEIEEKGIPLAELEKKEWQKKNNIRYLGELFERYKDRNIDIKAVLLCALTHERKEGDINSNQLKLFENDLYKKAHSNYNSLVSVGRILFYEKYESKDLLLEIIKETLTHLTKIDYYSIILLNWMSSKGLLDDKRNDLFKQVVDFLKTKTIDIDYNNSCFCYSLYNEELLIFFKDFISENKITKAHLGDKKYIDFMYLKKIGTFKSIDNTILKEMFKYPDEICILNLLLCKLRYKPSSKVLETVIYCSRNYIINLPWNHPIFDKLRFVKEDGFGRHFIGDFSIWSYNFSGITEENLDDFLRYVIATGNQGPAGLSQYQNIRFIKKINKDLFFALKDDSHSIRTMFNLFLSFEDEGLVIELFDDILETIENSYHLSNGDVLELEVLIKGLNFNIIKDDDEVYRKIINKLSNTSYQWLSNRATPDTRIKILRAMKKLYKEAPLFDWSGYMDDEDIHLDASDLMYLQDCAISNRDYILFIEIVSKIDKYKSMLEIEDDDIYELIKYLIKNSRNFDFENLDIDEKIKSRFNHSFLQKVDENRVLDEFWDKILHNRYVYEDEIKKIKDILKNKTENEKNQFFKKLILRSINLHIETIEKFASCGLVPMELFFTKFRLVHEK